jgi:hypothetical protein
MCFLVFEIERKRAVVACRQLNLGLCSFIIRKLFVECSSYMNQGVPEQKKRICYYDCGLLEEVHCIGSFTMCCLPCGVFSKVIQY